MQFSDCGEKAEGWRQSHNTMSSCGSKYMGGVDQGGSTPTILPHQDKMCKELQVHIFWFLVDVIITNAYILSHYSLVTSSMRSLKSFQLTLATQLIGNYCTRKRAGRPRSTRSMPHPPAPRHLLNMMALPPHTTIIVPLFICHLTRQKAMHLLPGVQAHQSKARDSLVLQRL